VGSYTNTCLGAAETDFLMFHLEFGRNSETISSSSANGGHDGIAYGKSRGVGDMHYLLIYDLASDYLERRASFRAEHLKLAKEANERGELVLAGALADPADKAILMFQGESPAAAESFAKADPYVANGLVADWQVRAWTTVVGRDAAVTP
jgi:uncharacterized protein YciI